MCVRDFEVKLQNEQLFKHCFFKYKIEHSRGFELLTSAFEGPILYNISSSLSELRSL